MKLKFACLGFIFAFITECYAVEPLPDNLIDISSKPGMVLFRKNINQNLLKLLEHFTTQKTVTYCGIASAVMVLNSSGLAAPIDFQHAPYHYFTQEDFFNEQVRQVITPEEVQKEGISLSRLNMVIKRFGLNSEVFFANDLSKDEFRSLLKNALLNQQFIIVNFLRSALQQQGDGHHSPIAAYDEKTDQFLILDVARYKYPAYWVTVDDLWSAVNTKDNEIYRGFIIINA
ncbi:phytochelatin synthase family protein [Legionella saoudiensis]|uniref:phytochelatin synthase family protein n=1 Tax=Legionella saoudiensis TaxID=1750561 RepID=UPI000730B5D3|nr:phytochelatin synthase family protein [Legionella saoudiensis]